MIDIYSNRIGTVYTTKGLNQYGEKLIDIKHSNIKLRLKQVNKAQEGIEGKYFFCDVLIYSDYGLIELGDIIEIGSKQYLVKGVENVETTVEQLYDICSCVLSDADLTKGGSNA